jgi:hypothetical protein
MFHDPKGTMTGVTGPPLTELTILTIDASTPGELAVTIDEHIQCPSCGHTGAAWRIPLAPTPLPPITPGQRRRVEDPGG